MGERRKMSDEEIQSGLKALDGWTLKDGKLHRELQFDSFVDAFAFMTKVAICAEGMDHHPEWFNVYNRVIIDLSTHDLNGISTLDFELAEIVNSYLS